MIKSLGSCSSDKQTWQDPDGCIRRLAHLHILFDHTEVSLVAH